MFQSTYADIEIPDVSIHEFLFANLSEAELEKVAIVDGMSGAETTYRQLIVQIDLLAGALAARGLGVGSTIGVLCPNVPAFATVFHGILRAGATATTINALYRPEEIANQLTDAGAEWLFTVSPLLPGAKAAAAGLGIPDDRIVVLDGAEGHPSLRDLLAEGHAAPDVSFDPATHLAVLPYSSGTTGKPKGVMLTHRNLVANVAQAAEMLTVGPDDRVLAVLPFFHIYGMTVLLNFALLKRAGLVTMPKFDLVEFLRIIQEHRTTWVFVAPPIAVALAKHPIVDQYDLSAIRVIFSGAAPLDGALAAAVAKRLDCEVVQGYGMTETSPATNLIPAERTDVDKSSIGPLVPNTEARLVDPETGADVVPPADGVSAPGELWIRGPQVMAGYLNRPDATADGIFRIVDRLKELIKYKGYQVAPAVLEALLLEHPQIADAAVIGANDADGQEVPKAFVVRQADADLSAEGVMEFVASRVAPHEKVRLVEFIDVIPKSSAGKILRKDLRARV
ncbi:MAG: AMP-binding protein [Microbacterium sp.]